MEANTQKTILVAENNESDFLLFKVLIGKQYHLLHAYNGQEAIDMFVEYQPDLIIMDLEMPVINGLEATKIIRQQSITIPIIAQIDSPFEQQIGLCKEAECTDYLQKPLSPKQLKAIIGRYI